MIHVSKAIEYVGIGSIVAFLMISTIPPPTNATEILYDKNADNIHKFSKSKYNGERVSIGINVKNAKAANRIIILEGCRNFFNVSIFST